MMGADAYTSLTQTTQMTAVYSEIFQSDALRNLVSGKHRRTGRGDHLLHAD